MGLDAKRLFGAFLVILAGFFSAVGTACYKQASHEGLQIFELVVFRFGLCFILSTMITILSQQHSIADFLKFLSDYNVWICGLNRFVCVILAYIVLEFTSVGNWQSIYSFGVAFSLPLAAIWINQPVYIAHVICLITSLVGALILVNPYVLSWAFKDKNYIDENSNNTDLSFKERILVFLWIVSTAFEFVGYALVRNHPALLVLIFEGATVTIGAATISVAVGTNWNLTTGVNAGWALSFGVLTLIHMGFRYGSPKFISVAEISIIVAFDKIWGYACDVVFFGEPILWNSILGSLIILASVFSLGLHKYIHQEEIEILREKKKQERQALIERYTRRRTRRKDERESRRQELGMSAMGETPLLGRRFNMSTTVDIENVSEGTLLRLAGPSQTPANGLIDGEPGMIY